MRVCNPTKKPVGPIATGRLILSSSIRQHHPLHRLCKPTQTSTRLPSPCSCSTVTLRLSCPPLLPRRVCEIPAFFDKAVVVAFAGVKSRHAIYTSHFTLVRSWHQSRPRYRALCLPQSERGDGPPTSAYHMRASLTCLLYTSPSPRDGLLSRMPSSA